MRETVTIQVGQCGNQIGNAFWSLLLQEHEKTPDTDDALSAFFRFAPQKDGRTYAMKARALLIDMECGPLTETMKGPLGPLFDDTQFVMDVYGSGNNFAHGHYLYGPQYRSKFEEGLRKNAEQCDSLQTFIVTHSLGGGTGSGVGTYVLELLADLYPEIYRFSACVYPQDDDDVVTSPYNSMLATRVLSDHADCVFPIDNNALQKFAELEATQVSKKNEKARNGRAPGGMKDPKNERDNDKGFDAMNNVAARMLCHLTSSSRFSGDMNVDMNEICTNLVPFPRLQFLMTALNPQRALPGESARTRPITGSGFNNSTVGGGSLKGSVQRAFTDILTRPGQITAGDPCTPGCITIASAFLSRGDVRLSDFIGCVTSAQRKDLRFPLWNQDACKIGMCGTPAIGEEMSVLGVYNSTAFGQVLTKQRAKFNLLYRRKAMLHHYTEFVDEEVVAESDKIVCDIIADYQSIEDNTFKGRSRTERREAAKLLSPKSIKKTENSSLFPAF